VRKLILRSATMLYGARPDNPLYLMEDHLLRGNKKWSFIGDKLDAERQVAAFAERRPKTCVTVLRLAHTIGQGTRNYVTSLLLRQRLVPVLVGYDPLFQMIHELDVVAAFHTTINEDHAGVFNIVAPGVMPLASMLRTAGRLEVPMPYPVAAGSLELLFGTHLVRSAPAVLDYLRYPCVASGEKAAEQMGFRASYSTLEALRDFTRVMLQRSRNENPLVARATSMWRG
jgi:UDP-glucose 4-epimerase